MAIFRIYEDGKESNTIVCDDVATLAKVCSKVYTKKPFEMRELTEADGEITESIVTRTIVKTTNPPADEISPIKGPKEETI